MSFDLSTRVLVTGLSGRLGYAFLKQWENRCQLAGTCHTNKLDEPRAEWFKVDLAEEKEVKRLFEWEPDVVVHAASWTDLDQCEIDPEGAKRNIVDATRHVAKAAREKGAKLVFISTDCVYGDLPGPHREDGPCEPCNVYGALKLDAEGVAMGLCPDGLVLRVNFFGWSPPGREGLAEWILRMAREGREIPVWTDVFFSPAYSPDIVRLIEVAVGRDLEGVYNCGAADGLSKAEFARFVREVFGLVHGALRECEGEAFKRAARRAPDMRMDVSRLTGALGVVLPTVLEGIRRMARDKQIDK
jgi:dTDP-4-dehydrorhamnose reductase